MRFVYVWQRLFPFLEVLGNVFKTFQAWFCFLNTLQCFILTVKSQILSSDMHANTPTLIRRIVCTFPECRRFLLWYVPCFLRRSQFWAQTYSQKFTKILCFSNMDRGSVALTLQGTSTYFTRRLSGYRKIAHKAQGCIRIVKMRNLILWFMRNGEEVGRTACKNRMRH